jgi:uracil-DNA glycosylase
MDVQMELSWKEALKDEFDKPYFEQLALFLKTEKALGKIIYPPGNLFFNAFAKTPFEKIKVVILGQDPYHNKGQAHGLCFSVPNGIPKPPSLLNIFKELKNDLGIPIPETGNLEKWAEQGVLLLNASLSVRENEPGSHGNKGWIAFTDHVIKKFQTKKKESYFYCGADMRRKNKA